MLEDWDFKATALTFSKYAYENAPRVPTFLEMLHYTWFISHAVTLIGTFIYIGQLLRKNGSQLNEVSLLYSLTGMAAAVTYTIVTYRRCSIIVVDQLEEKNGSSSLGSTTNSMSLSEVLKTENAQLLAFSLLWLSTSSNIFKILPFAIYSSLNLGSYLLNDVFPHIQLSTAIRPLMEYLENPLLLTAAHLEAVVFFILLQECYLTGDGYAIILYLLIWGLRVESSEASRCSLYTLLTIIDYAVYQDYNPESLRATWSKVKKTITMLIPLTTSDKQDTTSMYCLIDQFLPSLNIELSRNIHKRASRE